ncbi:2OG-Fe(II) oxygenase [Lottiidibacillus patelloidae]|uniref:2OG-Fe(II) oxygenase n=1 Tax=Lottiidibacillus patelloidae TaxID=2670334 RepID=A0A263BRK1_9BACI|nr:2OG-Fe(II) oxygenase [Lottiidibacillus patelloidae]
MLKQPLVTTLNLKDYTHGTSEQRKEFAQKFGESLRNIGFIILEGHGVDHNLLDKNYDVFQKFFGLPVETKSKYDTNEGGVRGYTGFGKEKAKDAKVADLKEFWHVGQQVPDGHPLSYIYPKNVWVEEIPEMKSLNLGLYTELERVAKIMLEALAMYFDLRQDFFTDMITNGNSIIRAIHYPPIGEDADPNAVRAGAHEDINLITILPEATESGLELLSDGEWHPVEAEKGQLIVDAGDMLSRITNEFIPATTHRVVNPAGAAKNTSRFSMPFFVHPYPNALLQTIPSTITDENPEKYPTITAGDFLYQRLVEIGLIKE